MAWRVTHVPRRSISSVPAASAAAFLGPEHPLVRAEEVVRVLAHQASAVGALLAGSGAALLTGVRGALSLVAVAALAVLVLVVRLAWARGDRRDAAVELIAGGVSGLPLDAVRRECARLSRPGRARALARSLEGLREEAAFPCRRRPLYVPAVIRAVDRDLAEVARLLAGPAAGVATVARAERLLGSERSPLYESDVARLREELQRLRFLG